MNESGRQQRSGPEKHAQLDEGMALLAARSRGISARGFGLFLQQRNFMIASTVILADWVMQMKQQRGSATLRQTHSLDLRGKYRDRHNSQHKDARNMPRNVVLCHFSY